MGCGIQTVVPQLHAGDGVSRGEDSPRDVVCLCSHEPQKPSLQQPGSARTQYGVRNMDMRMHAYTITHAQMRLLTYAHVFRYLRVCST